MATEKTIVPVLSKFDLSTISAALAVYRGVIVRQINSEKLPDIVAIRKAHLADVDTLHARVNSLELPL